MEKDTSIRQLPAGKMQNLKKMFENEGEHSNSKPTPPARPPMPPSRIRSPARPPPRPPQSANNKPRTKDPPDTGQKTAMAVSSGGQSHENRRVSPTVSRRITALMGSSAQDSENNNRNQSNVSNNAAVSESPKKMDRRNQPGATENSSGDTFTSRDNPLYSGSTPEPDIKDLYSKVRRNKKKEEDNTKHTSLINENCDLQRREAVRLNVDNKRKTVANLDSAPEVPEKSGVSVASRTKMFNQPKNEKPTPPKKPEAIKRQASLRTPVESNEKRVEEQHQEESNYCDPWENSCFIERLKKQNMPQAVSRPVSSVSSSTQGKVALDPRPSVPLVLPTRPDSASMASPVKAVPKAADASMKSKPGPPPKPPRTHAHDEYLKGKQQQDMPTPRSRPPSQTAPTTNKGDDNEKSDVSAPPEIISVRDRISKMQNQTPDSPSRSSVGSTNEDTPNVTLRNQRPSRPPPPRRRPNSGGHPPCLKMRPFSQLVHSHEGPCIIPVSPSKKPMIMRQTSTHGISGGRNPRDQLPPAPDNESSSSRFPLRRSFSSASIHGSQASSLNAFEDESEWSHVSQFSYNNDSEYEAVIDPDGYAVPNEFLKLPTSKQASDVNFYGVGESPHRFLTRIDGFGASPLPGSPPFIQDGSPAFGANTAMRDQTLDKVNKKKMLMVKQKINQVYADVDIIIRGTSQNMEDEEHEANREAVVDQATLNRRIEYCSTIRQKTHKSIKKSKEYLNAIYPQLFEYCLIVGLRLVTDSTGYEPYIIHKFPENVSSNLSVPSFCFPDASIFKPGSITSLSESYSFVMTSADGTRVYGYCRRIQPSDSSLPEVICIISPIDAFNMYNTLLNEIEIRRRKNVDLASEVIAASFGRPLPKPGKTCHIRTLDDQGEMETIFLTRPSDNRLNDVNYESPLVSLGTDKLVKVFSSMLMERRIILCSSNLSVLTQTVHALCALLYPFQWQHVYIPLLPIEMLDVVCSPTPFIVGVLSAYLPQVLCMEMEEVFIVDLDKKAIVRSLGDEATILPKKIQRALKTAINMCKIDTEARNAQWLMVAESFLRMFIEVIGHFSNHVCTQQDGNRIFQKEGFIIEVVSKEVRQFLEWFTETQMFEVFIVNHVEKSDWGSCDLFMQRLQDFKETKEESRRHRGLGAKVKNFGKALKTKLAAT